MSKYPSRWWHVFVDSNLLLLLLLGFASGLPLLLTASTLAMRLDQQYHMPFYAISLLSLATVPRVLGFMIAPMLDTVSIPYLTKILGLRRSWLLLIQVILLLFLCICSIMDLGANLWRSGLIISIVCLISTAQDIIIQAYQKDTIKQSQYGNAEALYIFGYRFGMVVASAGVLYLVDNYGWNMSYLMVSCTMLIGICTTFSLNEGKITPHTKKLPKLNELVHEITSTIPHWQLCLLIMFTYKIGDHLIGNMSSLFFVDLGFSNVVIANAKKVFGTIAAIMGGFIGAYVISCMSIIQSLLLCMILHGVTTLLYVWLSFHQPSIKSLYLVVGLENITGGMRTIALLSFQLSLCNGNFSATKIGIMTSIVHLARSLFSSTSGAIVGVWGWSALFSLATFAYLPVVLIILYYKQRLFSGDSITSTTQNMTKR